MSQQKNNEDVVTTPETTRRDFLTLAGGAAVAGVIAGSLGAAKPAAAAAGVKMASGIPVPAADAKKMEAGVFPKGTVMAKGRAIGANDRVNVAFAGLGNMGSGHLNHFSDEYQARNIVVGGVCDVYRPRLEGAQKRVAEKGAGAPTVVADKDYRRLLENKDIDAVVIATPEHWHAQIAIHAMEAGKHVYIQKPMTRYLDEAFQIHDTAKRTNRVVQIGSQGCSDFKYHAAGKAIREGKLGPLVMGQSSYTRNSAKGEWNYDIWPEIGPDTLDWEMWLGSAPQRPWAPNPARAGDGEQPLRDDPAARYRRYRKYTDYSAGILGDLMPHRLHPFMIAAGNPQYPTRVTAMGTLLGKDREVHDTVQVLAEFPSKWTMLFVGSTVNEQGVPDLIRGHKASIYFGQNVEIRPERAYSEEIEGGPVPLEGPTGEPHQRHEIDWITAIRTGKKPNCDIDLATKVQTIISLAEMSLRLNKTMLFDEKTRKVTAG